MKRRDVLGAMAGAGVLVLPRFARAQAGTGGRIPKIGWLTAQRRASLEPYLAEVRAGLAEFGHVEGKSLLVEYRFGDDDISRVPSLAADLVAQKVDVIVAQGAAVAVLATLNLPVPLVYVTSGDPVVSGFADSLSKPKNNMTGITFMAAEMNGKRMEILKDIRPGMKRIALIGNPEHPGSANEFGISQEKAAALGLNADRYATQTLADLESAFRTIAQAPVDALSVFADGFAVQYRDRIIAFGMEQKIPVTSGWAVFAQSGALCTYGPRLSSSYRRLSTYIHKVITGSKTADLPVERPATFELILNVKSAKRLGIEFPGSVMARADDVIE